ncbi:MAG: hypothetical protein ABH956_03490 [Candidatus Nealsonbacteria bacterium]
MILDFFNRRISTEVGVAVLFLCFILAGWIMIKEYKEYEEFMKLRFDSLEIDRVLENKKN